MTDLNTLFERWETTYPENVRAGFHRDGIIDEVAYDGEPKRVLFVLLEPNSKGGAYDRYYGEDLRRVFQIPMSKEVNRNLGLWTRYLLDGSTHFERLDPGDARDHIRRVALMNLKKIAGSGRADYISISQHAWQDREFLRDEVRLIGPTLIVTCGPPANRIFAQVVADNLQASPPDDVPWRWEGATVLPANHPSLRPVHAEGAFARLVRRYSGEVVPLEPTGVRKAHQQNSVRLRPTEGTTPAASSDPGASRTFPGTDDRRSGWILRPNPGHVYRMNEFLQGRFIAIGWPKVGDLTLCDRDRLLARLQEAYPGLPRRKYGDWIGTLLRFRDGIMNGDLVVVCPSLTDAKTVAIAEVVGPCRYVHELDVPRVGYPHHRPVRWVITGLPRSSLPAPIKAGLTQGTLHRTSGEVLEGLCKESGWL